MSKQFLLWRIFGLDQIGYTSTTFAAAALLSPHNPKQNHILAALSEETFACLLPDLRLIEMPLGWAVYESGGYLGHVYFPTTSLVFLLYVTESGASAEIAITGNEGLVGISLFQMSNFGPLDP
jgi:hypothetical protein